MSDLFQIATDAIDDVKNAKMVVQSLVQPFLNKFNNFRLNEQQKIEISQAYEDYLLNSYRQLFHLHTLVIREAVPLLELYVPLTIKSIQDYSGSEVNFQANRFNSEFFKKNTIDQQVSIDEKNLKSQKAFFDAYKYKNIIVVDSAGMGKSTLLKYWFLKCIEQNDGIPIFIELRKINKSNNLFTIIKENLNLPLNSKDAESFINQQIMEGDFVFLLDGFDEISEKNREFCNQELSTFIQKFAYSTNNIFIVSSRPDERLSSFGGFTKLEIKTLQAWQAYKIIENYDPQNKIAEKLISDLKAKTAETETLKDLLVTPLLVTLLIKTYQHKPVFPGKVHLFYEQIFDALYESHDLLKDGGYIREKKSGLAKDDFHRILRASAIISYGKNQIEFTNESELRNHVLKASNVSELDIQPSNVVDDLVSAVPLFKRDGLAYVWMHKSIQEYFAAMYIYQDSNEKKEEYLTNLVKYDFRHRNLLQIYFELDPKQFNQYITYPLAKDLIKYRNNIEKTIKTVLKNKNLQVEKTKYIISILSITTFNTSYSISDENQNFPQQLLEHVARNSFEVEYAVELWDVNGNALRLHTRDSRYISKGVSSSVVRLFSSFISGEKPFSPHDNLLATAVVFEPAIVKIFVDSDLIQNTTLDNILKNNLTKENLVYFSDCIDENISKLKYCLDLETYALQVIKDMSVKDSETIFI